MKDRDVIGEIAAELKLSRRKVERVLDLWEAALESSQEEVGAVVSAAYQSLMSQTMFGSIGKYLRGGLEVDDTPLSVEIVRPDAPS